MSGQHIAEKRRIREENDSAKKCLTVCAQAYEHANKVISKVFEDVAATPDAAQIIAFIIGELISVNRIICKLVFQQHNCSVRCLILHRNSWSVVEELTRLTD
jgi:hypothetical protein